MNDAKQTPLTDLLRRVPHDMSVVHESPDQQGTMNTAIGRLMHDAADDIGKQIGQATMICGLPTISRVIEYSRSQLQQRYLSRLFITLSP